MNNYGYNLSGLELPPYSVAIISAGTVDNPTRVDYYGLEAISGGASLPASAPGGTPTNLTTAAEVLAAGGHLICSLHIAGGGLATRLVWAARTR